jgi:hypothetical protein
MAERAPSDQLECAIVGGAIAMLRKHANVQRQIAHDGTVAAGDKYPGVLIRSPEAACAATLAADWDEVADLLDSEGGK